MSSSTTPPSGESDRNHQAHHAHSPRPGPDLPRGPRSSRDACTPSSTKCTKVPLPIAIDEEASELLVNFHPLPLLGLSAACRRPPAGDCPGDDDDDDEATPPPVHVKLIISPGRRKKQLFLERLERRGLSHSDPQPNRASLDERSSVE